MPHTAFASLSDDDLHAAVRRLTARSNVTLADLLAHLGEVETRGIHRSRACATLYTYCLYELRMSEDAAFRRSKAARLVHRHPELHGVVSRGEIHLTGLLMIAPYLGGVRHVEVIERARFRSKREIARLIAALDPRPEVPPRIEPIAPARSRLATAAVFAESLAGPVRSIAPGDRPEDWIDPRPDTGGGIEGGHEVAAERDGALDAAEENLGEAERALEQASEFRREARSERPLRYKVQFTATQEFVNLLDEAFELLGYKKKAASMPELQLRALRELVERLRKRKTGVRRNERSAGSSEGAAPARVEAEPFVVAAEAMEREPPEGAAPARVEGSAREAQSSEVAAPARYIPVAVRRAVWARDASRCACMDDRGVRCSEMRGLEVHHREAHALGGLATVSNLELRCRAHNTLAAEQDFGREYMDWMRGGRRKKGRLLVDRARPRTSSLCAPHGAQGETHEDHGRNSR